MSFNNIRNPQLRRDLVDIFGDIISYASGTLTIAGNVAITGSLSYGSVSVPVSQSLMGTLTVGITGTGYDVKFWGDTAGKYWLWDEDADGVVLVGTFTQTGNMAVTGTFTLTGAPSITGNMDIVGTLSVGVDNTGHDVKFFGATASKYWLWDESEDEMVIAGSVDVTGNTQLTGTLTVGVNETGHDVQFFGTTDGKYWLWDEDADGVVLVGTMSITGNTAITGTVGITGATTIAGANKVQFRDTGLYVYSSTDGQLDIIGDTKIQITAPTIDLEATDIALDGDVAIDGAHTFATGTGAITLSGEITLADAVDIVVNVTTGTKIGTAVGQKLGFWNVTPIVQPADADQADQGAMTAVLTGVDTGTDMTADQAATIVADITALDTLLTVIRTALVDVGIMKGEA